MAVVNRCRVVATWPEMNTSTHPSFHETCHAPYFPFPFRVAQPANWTLNPSFSFFHSKMKWSLGLLFAFASCRAAFVAIDYGSEWTKASLMTPGRAIDVLLNTDSKRKIQSVVAWNRQERSFGTDAYNLVSNAATCAHHQTHEFSLHPLGRAFPKRLFPVPEIHPRMYV